MRKGAEEAIREAMDACLLNDEEWAAWEKVMTNKRYKTMEKKQAALEQVSRQSCLSQSISVLTLSSLTCRSSRMASRTGSTRTTTLATTTPNAPLLLSCSAATYSTSTHLSSDASKRRQLDVCFHSQCIYTSDRLTLRETSFGAL